MVSSLTLQFDSRTVHWVGEGSKDRQSFFQTYFSLVPHESCGASGLGGSCKEVVRQVYFGEQPFIFGVK